MELIEILRKLGGPTQISRRFNITPQAISGWAHKGRVPPARVPAMVALSQDLGLDFGPELFYPLVDWSALR